MVPLDPEGPRVRRANVDHLVSWDPRDHLDPLASLWAMMRLHYQLCWVKVLPRARTH